MISRRTKYSTTACVATALMLWLAGCASNAEKDVMTEDPTAQAQEVRCPPRMLWLDCQFANRSPGLNRRDIGLPSTGSLRKKKVRSDRWVVQRRLPGIVRREQALSIRTMLYSFFSSAVFPPPVSHSDASRPRYTTGITFLPRSLLAGRQRIAAGCYCPCNICATRDKEQCGPHFSLIEADVPSRFR